MKPFEIIGVGDLWSIVIPVGPSPNFYYGTKLVPLPQEAQDALNQAKRERLPLAG